MVFSIEYISLLCSPIRVGEKMIDDMIDIMVHFELNNYEQVNEYE